LVTVALTAAVFEILREDGGGASKDTEIEAE
jgi:hypothetical protein